MRKRDHTWRIISAFGKCISCTGVSKIINYGPLSELRHQLVEGGYDSTGEIFPQHRGVSLYIYDVKHLQLENNNFSDFET